MPKTKIPIIIIAFLLLTPILSQAAQLAIIPANNFTYPIDSWHFDIPDQKFGFKRAPGIFHLGDDVAAPKNSPIYAIATGIVKHIGIHTNFGTVILIEHTLPNHKKIVSLYGHLKNNVKVTKNQFVNKNQIIGYLGDFQENGGWSEHLHFGIRKGPYINVNKQWVYWGLGPQDKIAEWYNPTKFLQRKIKYQALDQSKIITAPNYPGRSHIRLFKNNKKAIKSFGFFAFSKKNTKGCQIALGDIDSDDFQEIIVSSNFKKPIIKIFKKRTQNIITKFKPFSKKYKGKINLATADLDLDGQDEIITTTSANQFPKLKIFHYNIIKNTIEPWNHQTEQLENETIEQWNNRTKEKFNKLTYPFGLKQKTGINLTTIDLNQDGKKEILVTPASKRKTRLKYWNGQQWIKLRERIFGKYYYKGAKLTAGDINGDGIEEIIAGSGSKKRSTIKILNSNGKTKKRKIFPFHHTFKNGINITTTDFNNDNIDEIIVSKSKGQSIIKVYQYNKKYPLTTFFAYNEYFKGGINIVGVK